MEKRLQRVFERLELQAQLEDIDSIVHIDDVTGSVFVWTRERGQWFRVNRPS